MNDVPLSHEPERAPPAAVYPTLGQAIGLLLLAMALQLVLGAGFVHGLGGGEGLRRNPSLWGLLNVLALGPVIVYGWRRAGGGLDVFRVRPIPPGSIVPVILCVIGTGVLVSELDNVAQLLMGPPPAVLDLSWMFTGEAGGLLGVILLLMVVAPVTEELLFRGLILRGLLARFGSATAVVVTALLFALFHVNPWQFAGAFLLGLLFGWFYLSQRSLVPCLIGHATANGFPLVVTAAFAPIPGFTQIHDQVQFHPLWLDLLGLCLVAWGGWWLRTESGRE